MANINININENTPPNVDNSSITIDNKATVTLTTNLFNVNYNDLEGDLFNGIIIKTLPNSGTLIYGGNVVTSAPLNISKVDLDEGKLEYQADQNNANAHTTSFDFDVCDDRGACGP